MTDREKALAYFRHREAQIPMPGARAMYQEAIKALEQHEVIWCKDCKHWKDSDGVYRRGVDAESKCPLNIQEVYAGTFYCGYAERRTDE